MDAWVASALARFDRLKELGDRVARSAGAGMQVYAQELAAAAQEVLVLRSEQAGEAAPASLTAIGRDVDELYGPLYETYDILAAAYATIDTGLAQQGFAKAGQADALARQIRGKLREVVAPCGIRIPAA
jgi:hypothetical protein